MKRTFFSALVGGIFFAQNRVDLEPDPAPTKPLPEEANAASAYSPLLRRVSALLILSIVNMACLPLAHALEYQRNQVAVSNPGAGERYSSFLSRLKTQLSPDDSTFSSRLVSQKRQVSTDIETLDRLRQELEAEWAQLKTQWREAGVASSVFAEQEQLEASFYEQHQALRDRLLAANTEHGVAELQRFTEENVAEPTHLPIDLDNLPWQVEQGQARAPLTDAPALEQLLKGADSQKSARVNSVSTPAADAQKPVAKSAGPADLAQTLDAPHTDAIKALAAQLGNNPHKIYQWVHDNIYFFPSYGSVQGAQDTLDKRSGNAFDQASLLIALLRSSGIPARYVYGTVDIPAEQVMNWVGGVRSADAAQQVLGQGGIPNSGLTVGGQTKLIRMEHVWVEAYLEYQPHRGAKHSAGKSQSDTWVPMDAGFKQYSFTEGVDFEKNVPFDSEAFAAAALQGATVNDQEGWVQNINGQALQDYLDSYRHDLNLHITNMEDGNASVMDVLGVRAPKIDPLPYLSGTLPYVVKATAQRFFEVPDKFRHKFRYEIFESDYVRRMDGSPLLSFQFPTVQLAGKKLTLSWVAVDEANQRAIESSLFGRNQGVDATLQDIPRTMPASIHLKPQIRLDGEVKSEGGAMRAGAEPVGAGAFTRYGNVAQWDETTDQLVSGQQTAIGLSIQGVSSQQLAELKSRVASTQAVIEQAKNVTADMRPEVLRGLSAEHITGDFLTAAVWRYFASHESSAVIAKARMGIVDYPGLSYGLIHAVAHPNKIYGVVTTGVTFKGVNFDIGHMRSIRWSKSNAREDWINYNTMQGQKASALEHSVLEDFWTDRSQCRYVDIRGQINNPMLAVCGDAVSAVKALSVAAREGQKIYNLNSQNAARAFSSLSLGGAVGEEVRAALSAGKQVTIHERAVQVNGWSGYGYIVLDPDTGAGAYLIEGKGNGGDYLNLFGVALSVVGIAGLLMSASPVFLLLIVLISITATLVQYFLTYEPCGDARDDVALSLTAGVALVAGVLGFYAKLGASIVTSISAYIFGNIATSAIGPSCKPSRG